MTGAPAKADLLAAMSQAMSRRADNLIMSTLGVTTQTQASTLSMNDLRRTLDDMEGKIKGAFHVPAHMMLEPRHKFHPRMMTPFGGIGWEIRKTKYATEPDGYAWKPSRYRSARVAKKLRQRLGPMERRKPCMYRIAPAAGPPLLIVHPTLYDNLMARIAAERIGHDY